MPWSVADYNTNPALNTMLNGTDIAELCAAAGFNNALRQIMADIKTWINTQAITLPVSIANGGTGQTAAPAGLAALGGLGVEFRDLLRVDKSAGWAFSDSERAYGITFVGGSPATATINPQTTTTITPGAVYIIYNFSTSALAIARGTGAVELRVNGSGTSSDAVLAPGGLANLIHWGGELWTITGLGVS